ncbi:unnamed protein product [Prorocentrum cordatum]|uniref:SEC7 domain-containing protein n=1 Tax=Prorocentrum cordatum TaxID=2364126 RepID=A0ABN9TAA7_9DINO|nr:unnamed protein product [Polarella glacialis]
MSQHLCLPRESQQIDRIVEAFAKAYCEANPGSFPDEDSAYLTLFAIVMLNADVHTAQVKKKMTKQQFVSNTKLAVPLVEAVVFEDIYDRVQLEEITLGARRSSGRGVPLLLLQLSSVLVRGDLSDLSDLCQCEDSISVGLVVGLLLVGLGVLLAYALASGAEGVGVAEAVATLEEAAEHWATAQERVRLARARICVYLPRGQPGGALTGYIPDGDQYKEDLAHGGDAETWCFSLDYNKGAIGEPELRGRLLAGPPLSGAEREREWGRLLGRGPEKEGPCRACRPSCRLPALVDLLDGAAGQRRDEEVVFEAFGSAASEGREGAGRLAALFCERHAAWVAAGGDGGGGESSPDAHTFARMAQLLRYHRPQRASELEGACRAAGHPGLAAALGAACSSCGMPVALRDILLELPESDADLWTDADACGHTEADLLCLACDLVVLEGRQGLLLLLIVALLSEAAASLKPEAAAGLDEALRGALSLSLAARLSVEEIHRCVQDARAMLDSTPTTLQGVFDDAGAELPACAVAPEEVLRHTHGGAVGDWRLIVVDARMRPSTLALPVCVRLPLARHSARRGALRELPGDDAIHVCLVGDLAPTRGDDAFELCRYLSGPGVFRSHVSVVAGGWASLEMAAAALDLDLLPACSLEDERGESRDAAAAVAEAVGHVADVTGRVSGAAHQAVQTAWAEAPPLGPAVAGARVAAAGAAGQAAEAAGQAARRRMRWSLRFAEDGPVAVAASSMRKSLRVESLAALVA